MSVPKGRVSKLLFTLPAKLKEVKKRWLFKLPPGIKRIK